MTPAFRKKRLLPWAAVILALAALAFLFLQNPNVLQNPNIPQNPDVLQNPDVPVISAAPADPAAPFTVRFIDVGQGDSALVSCGGQTLLIDAGPGACEEALLSYLDAQGITRLDYLVATHPHEDHIGSMDAVVQAYDIGQMIMPQKQANTRAFEHLLSAVSQKNLKLTRPVPSATYPLGDALITVLAPVSPKHEDLNNDSVVLRISYRNTAFLFTGDAEALSEEEQLAADELLSADVLKVGHHGSSSSCSPAYLAAVSPSLAVISCGKDNSYGHPHQETTDALKRIGCTVLRTDLSGSIVLQSDGETVSIVE